ncbi:uncharacterized protein LOC115673964 [Syzygium oleosum]|uniref:uncharacterized protein LOC115673964 n=1 Tax=Syzygium oleosum TaxID=219896 RepID=UPI0024B87E7F|nr:uncharacterized protein LOC115673964 [Syzygium oleosum]
MYVTRLLSACRKSSSTLEELPNEGPFSGYLVITDVVAEEENTSCWGTCEIKSVKKFPFPQDRVLTFQPVYEDSPITKLWFIPALDRPLSSNIYYVINAEGKYRGLFICYILIPTQALINPEKIMHMFEGRGHRTNLFRHIHQGHQTEPFRPRDTYQVFQIHHHNNRGFFAESVAPDGFPPKHLRKKSWEVRTSQSLQPHLEEAFGLDMTLRACLPDFTFPISGNHPAPAPVVVGKWYCPCVFVRDKAVKTQHQIKKSMFYKMTLEQKWEELHTCENNVNKGNNKASVNVALPKEEASVFGMRAAKVDDETSDGFVWFRVMTHDEALRGIRLGVSEAIAEKMKWVMREGGRADDGGESGREVRVERVEEFKGDEEWKRFGCYILVESFVLTRLDGSLVLQCDFRHTHRIQCKWE